MATKILVCGSLNGIETLRTLWKRVSVLQRKHAFVALFCVGDVFAQQSDTVDDVRQFFDNERAPIQTFIVPGRGRTDINAILPQFQYENTNDDDVEEDDGCAYRVKWLGRCGIVCISDRNPNIDTNANQELTHREEDVIALIEQVTNSNEKVEIDVLLTAEFGTGFHTFTSLPNSWSEDDARSIGSPIIAHITTTLAPRYHFSSSTASRDAYIELVPYRNGMDSLSIITRFIGLASVDNVSKQKYLYACSLNKTTNAMPSVVSDNPYTAAIHSESRAVKRQKSSQSAAESTSISSVLLSKNASRFDKESLDQGGGHMNYRWSSYTNSDDANNGYVCRICHIPGHFIQDCPNASSSSSHPKPPPNGYICRLCNRAGHYIRDCPSSTNRTTSHSHSSCWFCLASPNVESHLVISIGDETYLALAKGPLSTFHVLVVPIEHIGSWRELQESTRREMNRYFDALSRMFHVRGTSYVRYERCIPTRVSPHLHIQVVEVPVSRANKDALLQALQPHPFELMQSNALLPVHPYVLVETGDDSQRLLLNVHEKVPLQLVRYALANSILEMPHRADWKSCQTSQSDELKMIQQFKHEFQAYDPFQG